MTLDAKAIADILKPKLRPRECAEALGVSTDYVIGEIRAGRLAARVRTHDSGRVKYRIEQEAFADWMRDHWSKRTYTPPPIVVETGVYFVCCGAFVKIGHARDIPKRVNCIQTGTPFDVSLLAVERTPTVQQAQARERELHARFKELRVRGEWFKNEPPLSNFIATIRTEAP